MVNKVDVAACRLGLYQHLQMSSEDQNNVSAPVLARWLGVSGKTVYELAKAGGRGCVGAALGERSPLHSPDAIRAPPEAGRLNHGAAHVKETLTMPAGIA